MFDDYFKAFPGLIDAGDEIFEEYDFDKVFYHRHTLVIKL